MARSEPSMTLHTMRERLAAQSRWASAHRSIVLRRKADESYAHVVARTADGSRVLTWSAESGYGKELTEALRGAALDFEVQFGRSPGPSDPVFISPSSDAPEPMTIDDWNTALDEVIERALACGIPTEPLLAWRELGYIVTEMNIHLFSPEEVRNFFATVRRIESVDYSNPE